MITSARVMASKSSGFGLWNGALKSAKYIVAPMVDQSELTWRMLSRRYGAELCYTPMLHAAVFVRDANYRKENLSVCPEDRPLIVQFCGNDTQIMLKAAKYAAPFCDAVDINLGCPQTIAKKGHYGAFLQDDWDLLTRMVGLLHHELSVPVTCKIRVFEDIERTVMYAQMLENAGCQLLTVHGRTREQKGMNMGLASWKHIKAVKENVKIPVFANGNIQYFGDIERCLKETGVEGIMSAEGNLFNPAIFACEYPPCWRVSEEYLELVHKYPCPISYVRGHLFKMWYHVLKQPEYQHYREKVGVVKTVKELESIMAEIKEKLLKTLSEEELRAEVNVPSIPFWRCQPYFRPSPQNGEAVDHSVKRNRSTSDGKDSEGQPVVVKRHKKRKVEKVNDIEAKKERWITCDACKANPKGTRCEHNLCKLCCRVKCRAERLDCSGHRFYIKTKLNIAETAQMLPQNNPLTGLNVDSGTNILVTTCTKDASDLSHTSTSDVVYK